MKGPLLICLDAPIIDGLTIAATGAAEALPTLSRLTLPAACLVLTANTNSLSPTLLRSLFTRTMSSLALPPVVSRYVAATNAKDTAAIASCFADSCTVQDEGKTYSGKQEVTGWVEAVTAKYGASVEPLSFTQPQPQQAVLGVKVSGSFPGSPINLKYTMELEQEAIRSLKIGLWN